MVAKEPSFPEHQRNVRVLLWAGPIRGPGWGAPGGAGGCAGHPTHRGAVWCWGLAACDWGLYAAAGGQGLFPGGGLEAAECRVKGMGMFQHECRHPISLHKSGAGCERAAFLTPALAARTFPIHCRNQMGFCRLRGVKWL